MTPEEHLLRWLISLKPERARHIIRALCDADAIDMARLVVTAQQHKGETKVAALLNVLTATMLGDDT